MQGSSVDASILIEEMTWGDVAEAARSNRVLLVPIGSLSKSHGVHLPLLTDFLCAKGISEVAARTHGNCIVAPVVSAGYFPAFARFPGTVSLSHSVFYGLVRETIECYFESGFRKIFLFDVGISTNAIISLVVQDRYSEDGIFCGFASIVDIEGDEVRALVERQGRHAGEQETSIVMALKPSAEKLSRLRNTEDKSKLEADTKIARVPVILDPFDKEELVYSPEGHIGDPTKASAQKGEAIVQLLGARLCRAIREYENIFKLQSSQK